MDGKEAWKMAEEGRFRDVPDEFKTEEMCAAAVKDWPANLEWVPGGLKTKELCMAAALENFETLRWVPEKVMDEEFCLAAVKENGRAIAFLPESRMTDAVCAAAVKADPKALLDIPERLRTEQLRLDAFRADPRVAQRDPWLKEYGRKTFSAAVGLGLRLAQVPKAFLSEAVCAAAVERRGAEEFEFVPKSMRGAAVYGALVRHSPKLVAIVPDSVKTAEMCAMAVQENAACMKHVPKRLMEQVEDMLKKPAPPSAPEPEEDEGFSPAP